MNAPSMRLLCKLGSIMVHAEEMIGPTGHGFDKVTLESLLTEPEVVEWRKAMEAMELLPRKRTIKKKEQEMR